jgi:hypothetical protein
MRWPVKILIPCLLLLSCGKGNGVVNDQPPSGTVIASGSFTGSTTSGAITGTVLVYDQCNGSYVVRLANLSAPGGIGLQVQADTTTGGQRLNVTTLGVISGNVNYPITTSSGTGFSIVYLHSPASNTDPAIATLNQSGAGC